MLALALVVLLAPSAATAETYERTGSYLDFATRPKVTDRPDVSFDAAGVPRLARNGRLVYNPVTISNHGLERFSLWATSGDEAELARAKSAADWLVANQRLPSGIWVYDYDFTVGGMGVTLRAPWSSAMAQGVAISLLTRMYAETGDPAYLSAAEAGTAPLDVPVSRGGHVTGFWRNPSKPFYEEYPTQPASYALNGFMFTLFGLYDLAEAGSSTGRRLFDSGIDTLKAALPYYDTPSGLSAYHLGHLTSPPRRVHSALSYHAIHVMQLRFLASVAPSETFDRYADRWAAYVPPTPRPRPAPPAAGEPRPARPIVPAPDRSRPVVSSLGLLARPRVGGRGVRVRLSLSEPSKVRFELARRRRARATRFSRLIRAGAGPHRLRIAVPPYHAGLRAGRFWMRVVARDAAGNASRPAYLRFRVLPRRAHRP